MRDDVWVDGTFLPVATISEAITGAAKHRRWRSPEFRVLAVAAAAAL
jgi:hypothetical protein